MLRTIIKREILEYLKSAKFLIGLLIAVVLTAAAMIINLQDYAIRHQDFLDAKKELTRSGFEISVFREPQVLGTLARGKDRDLGSQLKMSVMEAPRELTGYMGGGLRSTGPPSSEFSAVDFAFLVRVVLSLLVIFMAYSAVSEEKANGTLKLAMSNALPRDKVLLGKLLSGLVVVFAALLAAALVAGILLAAHPSVSLSGADLARMAWMLAVSALYLSAFFALGLFVSVKTNRPAVSLMVLLQAWVFLVIIYPNLSVAAAERFHPLPSEESINGQKAAAYQKFDAAIKEASAASRKGAATQEDRRKSDQAWAGVEVENYKIDAEFGRRQTVQLRLAELLSTLSPAALYDQAMNRLARTDIHEYEGFMDGAYRLWEKFVERWMLRYSDPEAFKKTPLPEFSFRSDSASEAAASLWPQGFILVLFNLICFALAYTGFLRKDLR
jgi:ABC-type transport system involved in multi-copper enzyme maturation permease subunit